jgi:hypothetical protein
MLAQRRYRGCSKLPSTSNSTQLLIPHFCKLQPCVLSERAKLTSGGICLRFAMYPSSWETSPSRTRGTANFAGRTCCSDRCWRRNCSGRVETARGIPPLRRSLRCYASMLRSNQEKKPLRLSERKAGSRLSYRSFSQPATDELSTLTTGMPTPRSRRSIITAFMKSSTTSAFSTSRIRYTHTRSLLATAKQTKAPVHEDSQVTYRPPR